jgi:hypothetical protein|eukprot:COSAG01_NODE_12581_length_1715_cov_1.797774_1_plen_72_part_00
MVYHDLCQAVLSAWSWAVHRAVDALMLLSSGQVPDSRDGAAPRVQGIAITGHSRGGKAALLAVRFEQMAEW